MRRASLLLLLSGVAITSLAWNARPRAAGAVPEPRASGPGNGGPIAVRGVSSCAAGACHNANGPPGSTGSEYTTWINGDPHSRAYTVLFGKQSRSMLQRYRQLAGEADAHPEKEPLCLRCHVHPDQDRVPRHERFSVSDGVGCESCHGAADKWLALHHQPEWKAKKKAEKDGLGWIDTKNPRRRAEACVACHVGRGDMDVNHDLIAAGHPRLRFEFGAYLANYRPKHWKASADRARYPDFEALAWLVGQVATAEAAVNLLEYRAANASAKDEARRTPWPEFAEYNCAACHHDLRSPSDRQGATGKRKAGELPWGTWYFSALPALADSRALGSPRFDLSAMKEHMQRRRPDATRVIAEAKALKKALHKWGNQIEKDVRSEDQWKALLTELAHDRTGLLHPSGAGGDLPSWEGATQLYLGMAAVHHGLSDQGVERRGVKEALQRLRDDLGRAFPRGRDTIYDTPSDFRPGRLGRDLKRLQDLLK